MENEKCFCHFNGYEVKDAEARKEIENIKNNVNAVSNEVATNKASITSIGSDVSKSKTDIEVLKGDTSSLKTTTSLNTASISANTENISNIDNKMGELENLNTNDKSSIVNAVNEIKNKVDSADTTLISEEVNTLKSNVGTLDLLETTDKSSIVNAINEINSRNSEEVFSADEIVIGTWIDGKPIYRKTFFFTSLADIKTGITNVDSMMKMSCFLHESSGRWRPLPWLYTINDTIGDGNWTGGYYFRESDGGFTFQVGSELAKIDKGIVILEYTKTTDSVSASEEV